MQTLHVKRQINLNFARQAAAFFAALLGAFCASATPPPPATLTLTGDWRIQVVAVLDDGTALTNTVEVTPTDWQTVSAERHASLPLFNPQAGGWAKGARLHALLAQECTSRFLLDPASLVLRSGPEADAQLLVVGRDYDADLEWGTFGRRADGRVTEGDPVFASYRHGWLRLDSIVLTADRRIELRTGEARSAAPTPPRLKPGEGRLANI